MKKELKTMIACLTAFACIAGNAMPLLAAEEAVDDEFVEEAYYEDDEFSFDAEAETEEITDNSERIITVEECENPDGHEYDEDEEHLLEMDPVGDVHGFKYYQCKYCDNMLVIDYTEPEGHEIEEEVVDPTCEESGITNVTCITCGFEYEKDETDPLGHDYAVTDEVEATCTEDGYTAYACINCGDSYEDPIPAAGHTVVIDKETDELTEGSHCEICGEVIEEQQEKEADATEDAIVETDDEEDENVPMTLEITPMVEDEEATESEADDEFELMEDEADDAISFVAVNDAETETESETDAILMTLEELSAISDTANTADESEDAIELLDETESESESESESETEHIHVPKTLDAVDPTCTEDGLTEGSICSECGEILEAQETVPALGHEVVVDGAVSATCAETGLTEGTHCERCGEILTEQTIIVALGHTAVVDDGVDPTCTDEGLTEGSHCSVCGEILTAQESIPALGHEYTEEILTAPTCTEEGWARYTCSVCGDAYEDTVPANGHTWEWVVDVEPTENDRGLRHQQCSVCGELGDSEEILPLSEQRGEADPVQTGDDTPIAMYMLLMTLSLVAVLGLGISAATGQFKKKENR